MGFLKKVANKIGIVKKSKEEEIKEERNDVKYTLEKKLKEIGFTESEIDEVFAIIEHAENKLRIKKDSLVGMNINNPNVNEDMKIVFEAIRNIQNQMNEDVRAKIAEIKGRKGI